MSKLKPLFARVLCKRDKAKKHGSILLPPSAEKRLAATVVEVVAVGPSADKSIKPGSKYIVGAHAGAWLNAAGTPMPNADTAEFYICADEDLLVEIVEEDENPGENIVHFPNL